MIRKHVTITTKPGGPEITGVTVVELGSGTVGISRLRQGEEQRVVLGLETIAPTINTPVAPEVVLSFATVASVDVVLGELQWVREKLLARDAAL